MKTPALSLLFAVLVLTSLGTSIATAGEFEFAEALAAYGYFDLAEEQFREIMNDSGLTAGERADGEFGLCSIKAYQAERIADLQEKMAAYDVAMECLRAYYTKNSDAPKANDARLQVGELQQKKGRFLEFKMDGEQDPKERSKFRTQAVAAYEDAIKEFEKIKSEAEDPNLLLKARYYSLESRWYAGYAGDEKSHLEKCAADAEEFVWDTEPAIIAYHAYILQGMALCKLGKLDDGMTRLETVTALNLKEVPPEVMGEVIALQAKAYFGIARALVEGARPKDVDPVYEAFTKKVPGGIEDFHGRGTMFWSGRAAEANSDVGKALVVYSRLAERGDFWGAKAKERLEQVLSIGGGQQVDPKTYMQMAEGYYGQRKWTDAIDAFQKALDATRKKKDPVATAEYMPPAYDFLGDCYFRLDRFHEAAMAYEAAAKAGLAAMGNASLKEEVRKKAVEVAESASYWSYVCYKRAYYQSYDAFDKGRHEQARAFFQTNFPKSPKNENINFEKAFDLEKQNRYLDAAAAYETVGKIADNYEESRFRIGYCYYREGLRKLKEKDKLKKDGADEGQLSALDAEAKKLFDTARRKLDDYKTYAAAEENALVAAEAREKRASLVASTLLIIASISLDLEDYDATIANLVDGRGDLHPLIAEDPSSVPTAYKYLVKSYLGRAGNLLGQAKPMEAGAERDAIVEKATQEVRQAQHLVDKLTNEFQGVSLLYFYSYDLGRKLQEIYRLNGQRPFKRESTLYLARWILQKEAEGRSSTFNQAYVVGRNLQEMALEEKEEDVRSEKWKRWMGDATKIFQLCLRQAKKANEIRSTRLRLARVYLETDDHENAVSQYYELYRENKKHSETVNSMANLFREIGVKQPAGKKLFEEVVRISREEEEGTLAELAAAIDTPQARGDIEARLVESKSFINFLQGKNWWSDSRRKQESDEMQKKFDSDPRGYGKWLVDEYKKAIGQKYDQIRPLADGAVEPRQRVIRNLALDLAVRLYVTIASATPQDVVPGELAEDPFFKGQAFKRNLQFPTNREWWESKYNLLECYHYLEQRDKKSALYENISLLYIPKDQDLSRMKTRGDELKKEAEALEDEKERETGLARADFYEEYVDMIDTFKEKMSRVAGQ